jgi:hypothetical protein
MSTSPRKSVFDATGTTGETHQGTWVPKHHTAPGGLSGRASVDAAAAAAASAEIDSISSAIAELQGRLEEAHKQIGSVSAVRATELEIGRLFVEAQRFSEASLSQLEQQIQSILAEAESKAMRILREATDEAHAIRKQAQQTANVPANTAMKVQAAISGFSNINNELVRELRTLNTMLKPTPEQMVERTDPAAGSFGSS